MYKIPIPKGRADERIRHIESKVVALWTGIMAGMYPAVSTPRVFNFQHGLEDKEMNKAHQMQHCQGIIDISEDIPKNQAITEQTPKDYLKEIAVRNPEFYAVYKDDLKVVREKLKALKEGSAE